MGKLIGFALCVVGCGAAGWWVFGDEVLRQLFERANINAASAELLWVLAALVLPAATPLAAGRRLAYLGALFLGTSLSNLGLIVFFGQERSMEALVVPAAATLVAGILSVALFMIARRRREDEQMARLGGVDADDDDQGLGL